MSANEKLTVRLGNKEFELRMLTVRQLQDIEGALLKIKKVEVTPISLSLDILRAALSRDHKDAADKIDEFEATRQQLIEESASILRFGEFEETKAGEPRAA